MNELVTFNDKRHYEEPKLVWAKSTGLTALIFLDSDRLGLQYRNYMFVGSVHTGHEYYFKLNQQRDELIIPKPSKKDWF